MKKSYLTRNLSTFALAAVFGLGLFTLPNSTWAQDPSPAPQTAQDAAAQAVPEPLPSATSIPTLEERMHQIEGLETVEVIEQSGVVTLRGEILDSTTRKLAEDVAKKTDGVLAVRNELRISSSVTQRLEHLSEQFDEKVGAAILFIPLLILAIFAVWLSNYLGRKLSRSQWLKKRTTDPFLQELMRRAVHGGFVFAGLLTALSLLGATALVGAVAGSAGVLGLALGFAFKDIAENYVAGLLLSLRRPFSPDDSIKIDSFEGKVAALTPRETILVMYDGTDLRIPNAMVFKSVLINFTRNALRRFEFEIVLDSRVSISTAQKAALALIAEAPGVIAEPAPASRVIEYGPNGSKLLFLAWVDQRESDLLRVRSNCIRAVKGSFKDLGFDLYTREIMVRQPADLAATHGASAVAAPAAVAATPASNTPTSPATTPASTPGQAAAAVPPAAVETAAEPEADHVNVDVSVNRDIDQTVRDTRQEVQQDTLVR